MSARRVANATRIVCSVPQSALLSVEDNARMMNTEKRRLLTGLLGLVLIMSACSDSTRVEEPFEASAQQPAATDSEEFSDGVTRFDGHAEGQQLVGGFIPELADLPVPEVAAFHNGAAYDASQDPRETAVQRVDFLLEPAEVADFYLKELTAQGYVAASGSQAKTEAEVAEFSANGIESFILVFDSPDGIPLQLSISPSNTGGNTSMNVNRFRSGTM